MYNVVHVFKYVHVLVILMYACTVMTHMSSWFGVMFHLGSSKSLSSEKICPEDNPTGIVINNNNNTNTFQFPPYLSLSLPPPLSPPLSSYTVSLHELFLSSSR